VDVADALRGGRLQVRNVRDVYMRDAAFDVQQMLDAIGDDHARALAEGFSGLSLTGNVGRRSPAPRPATWWTTSGASTRASAAARASCCFQYDLDAAARRRPVWMLAALPLIVCGIARGRGGVHSRVAMG
jgi:hypothetical protein